MVLLLESFFRKFFIKGFEFQMKISHFWILVGLVCAMFVFSIGMWIMIDNRLQDVESEVEFMNRLIQIMASLTGEAEVHG